MSSFESRCREGPLGPRDGTPVSETLRALGASVLGLALSLRAAGQGPCTEGLDCARGTGGVDVETTAEVVKEGTRTASASTSAEPLLADRALLP